MPPRIEKSEVLYNVTEGNMIILPCVTYANPPATIKWTQVNTMTSNSELDKYIMFDGSLQLKAKSSDNGKYRCEARNEVGVATSEMFLNVYSKLLKMRFFDLKIYNINFLNIYFNLYFF